MSIDGGSSVSDSIVVTVNALPPAPTISENAGVLTTGSVSGNQWFYNGSQISNANAQNYSATQDGDYTVMFTDGNSCSSVSTTYSYSVTVNTPIPVITSNGSLTICQGDSVMLTCSTANSYLWSTAATTQSIIVKTNGTYSVSIDGGAAVSNPTIVTVHTLPTVTTVSSPSSAAVCIGNSISLSGSGNALSYAWTGPITITNAQPFTPTAIGNSTFTVTGTAANNCTNTATRVVSVLQRPTVGVIVNPYSASVCEGSSVTLTGTGATTYTWSGGITNGVSFVPTTLGVRSYTVTGTSNSCTNTATQSITVNNCIGGIGIIEASTSVQEIKIYPNPNNGLFKIEVKNSIISRIIIVNLLGEIIYESTDQNLEFDLSSQPKGTYFVEVFLQDRIVHQKLIIQ